MILLKLMVTISSPASKNFSGPVVSPCPHVGPKEATSIIARAMMILTGVFQSWYLLGFCGLVFPRIMSQDFEPQNPPRSINIVHWLALAQVFQRQKTFNVSEIEERQKGPVLSS